MGLLDDIPQPYIPPHARTKRFRKTFDGENADGLNNFDRKEVSEDFSDSPFLEDKE